MWRAEFVAKLSEIQVKEIIASSESAQIISDKYNISITHAYRLKQGGLRWKYLEAKDEKNTQA